MQHERCIDLASQGLLRSGKRFELVTRTTHDVSLLGFHVDGAGSDWTIHDLRIEDSSQFAQDGPIPGDLFATSAIKSFVTFGQAHAGELIRVDVEYTGHDPAGGVFRGQISYAPVFA